MGELGELPHPGEELVEIVIALAEQFVEGGHPLVITGHGIDLGIVHGAVEPMVVAGVTVPLPAQFLVIDLELGEDLLFPLAKQLMMPGVVGGGTVGGRGLSV